MKHKQIYCLYVGGRNANDFYICLGLALFSHNFSYLCIQRFLYEKKVQQICFTDSKIAFLLISCYFPSYNFYFKLELKKVKETLS